jgi:hypothetical protein
MSMSSVYERDLLYPTENIAEPGSIHVEILNPNKVSKMPVILESRTAHSPLKHMDYIIRVMQTEIFDRILVDIKKNVNLYIKTNEDLKKEFKGKNYLQVVFSGDKIEYTGVDELEI